LPAPTNTHSFGLGVGLNTGQFSQTSECEHPPV
jgi:hypothetical protein